MNREYYSKDKKAIESKQFQLHKDIKACFRCGFTLEQIEKTLNNNLNEYTGILSEIETKKKR